MIKWPLCAWCRQPVDPKVCVKIPGDGGCPDLFVHWECVGEVKRETQLLKENERRLPKDIDWGKAQSN